MKLTEKLKKPKSGEVAPIHTAMAFLVVMAVVLGVFSILILISGFNLGKVYYYLIIGAFGSLGGIAETGITMAPLLLCSSGLILAFRSGCWNIGAEGQLYMGALVSSIIGIYVTGLPALLHIFLAVLVSFITGGAWAGLSGFLLTRFKANMIITTLLMNFVAIWFSYYILMDFLKPEGAFYPVSGYVRSTAELPILLKGTILHGGILIALFASIIVWFIFRKTSLGYSIDAVGANKLAAAYGGIKVNKIIFISMFLSGGLAGVAGMGEVLGYQHQLLQWMSPNYGFTAIAIAMIARLHPVAVIFVSLIFGALLTGGRYTQIMVGVPSPAIIILVGMVIIATLFIPKLEKGISSVQLSGKTE